ncbi:hypothetical protein C3L33_06210, partial [Rhododendron williamsianum]
MAFNNANRFDPQSAAEKAVSVIGCGFDLATDLRLSACKPGSSLIELDQARTKDLVVPGGVVVPNVSASIKCDKGERTSCSGEVPPRCHTVFDLLDDLNLCSFLIHSLSLKDSAVLPTPYNDTVVLRCFLHSLIFPQMSEQFNQELGLSGKIPSGLFNTMFGFRGCWQKDAMTTKSLAFDGWFISLYNIELARSQIILSEHVKKEVPASWDPVILAEFIEKYGTHVVVGLKMGGKDVIHIKQHQSSSLQPTEVQKLLKELADKRFSEDGSCTSNSNKLSGNRKDGNTVIWDLNSPFMTSLIPTITSLSKNDDMFSIQIRRGGIDSGQSHSQWLSTVSHSPNIISMSFVPIASLLSGVRGSGFLSHAINLYLRCIRKWADNVNYDVDSGNRPVTGIRLYLEGKRSDHLAVHLQHLSSLPESLQLSDDPILEPINEPIERGYFEPVNWSIFSHVCTAPVQHEGARIDDSASIVTKAWFEVKTVGMKKVLFLRLGFSAVASSRLRRSEWDGPTTSSRKSGFMSMLISSTFTAGMTPVEKPAKVDLNSAVYPGGPPLPRRAPKLMHFVDTKEMVRGPECPPGHWVVTGAKLCVEGGRITIKAKYSLLAMILEDSLL